MSGLNGRGGRFTQYSGLIENVYISKIISGVVLLFVLTLSGAKHSNAVESDIELELELALMLADVLRAARSEIASQQPNINNELVGDKGLSGPIVVERILKRLADAGKPDPEGLSPSSREGQLINAQLKAIEEILEENQSLINKKGIGFKGFVPAVFAQLSNERFGDKMGSIAEIKVTAPIGLVRNRKAKPDSWERNTIESKFLDTDWQKGKLFSEIAAAKNGDAFRVMVPEYYGKACLACHGGPSGELDITGYPKEGGQLDDLGGAISITLYQ